MFKTIKKLCGQERVSSHLHETASTLLIQTYSRETIRIYSNVVPTVDQKISISCARTIENLDDVSCDKIQEWTYTDLK
jgi:hypothetical protein